jgi:hypothetical protein
MPPAECGVGYPITYQYDIRLIAALSMMTILTGRLGDGAPVRVTYRAAMRSSARIRCTHALMTARCEKTWGSSQGAAGVRFYLLGVQQRYWVIAFRLTRMR